MRNAFKLCSHALRSASRTASPIQYFHSSTPARKPTFHARALRAAFLTGPSTNGALVIDPWLEAVNTGQNLSNKSPSSRLCYHTIIHGFLRVGLPLRASHLAEVLMNHGMRLRTPTLVAITAALCPGEIVPDAQYRGWKASRLPELHHRRYPKSDPQSTAAALTFLAACRHARHERTQEMISRVIQACLTQGQIISASLLFALIVTDWEARRQFLASQRAAGQLVAPGKGHETVIPTTKIAIRLPKDMSLERMKKLGLHEPALPLPYPSHRLMTSILDSMVLKPPDSHLVAESVQGLARIAEVLHKGSLPLTNIASLIGAMSTIPQGCPLVEIDLCHNRQLQFPDRAFRKVLKHLINHLPSSRNRARSGLPPLNITSYNALLHFALYHERSLDLTTVILDHMLVQRQPPLAPDISTHNTLLMAAQRLGVPSLGRAAVALIRRPPEPGDVHNPILQMQAVIRGMDQILAPFTASPLPPWTPSLSADLYTLTIYIRFLTSRGRPDLVVQFLYDFIPEFDKDRLPPKDAPDFKERKNEMWREALRRGVLYGPRFLCALLDALRMAGRSRMAMKVWKLAKLTEEYGCSDRDLIERGKGGLLPAHAYRIVLQMFAYEARKGCRSGHELIHSRGWVERPVGPNRSLTRLALSRHCAVSHRFAMQRAALRLLNSMPPQYWSEEHLDRWFFAAIMDVMGFHKSARRRRGYLDQFGPCKRRPRFSRNVLLRKRAVSTVKAMLWHLVGSRLHMKRFASFWSPGYEQRYGAGKHTRWRRRLPVRQQSTIQRRNGRRYRSLANRGASPVHQSRKRKPGVWTNASAVVRE